MEISALSFAGGLLAGLASSLHCAGMCGGIAAGLGFGLRPAGGAVERGRVLLLAQAGRVAAYTLAGAALGALAAPAYFAFDQSAVHTVMRWAAALTLTYIGLSVAGWAPSLAGLDGLGRAVAARLPAPANGAMSAGGPVIAGMIWGFLPCGLVYATLFYAMLSGSPLNGAAIMLGFGLGTVPAVTAAAFGITRLPAMARSPATRLGVGLAIVVIAVASVAIPWKTVAALCGFPVEGI